LKILVIGASGLIGGTLFQQLIDKKEDVSGTYYLHNQENFKYLDITNYAELNNYLTKNKPQIIFLPAAQPNVDYCEEYPEISRKINVDGIKKLAKVAPPIKSKIVFFSTDYIFSGDNGPYREADNPNPINEYGRQKLEAENIIRNTLTNYLIIRTTVVYGYEKQGKNFVIKTIENLKQGKRIKVPTDQISNPTFSVDLCSATIRLIEKNKIGIYNIAGNQLITRYDFSVKIAEIFGLDKNLITPVFTSDLNQKALRPLKAGLVIDKIQNELSIEIMSPEVGLKSLKNILENKGVI